jgi:hypothetical protein
MRRWRLRICHIRTTDGGHVVTSVTMAMMASAERIGMLGSEIVPKWLMMKICPRLVLEIR